MFSLELFFLIHMLMANSLQRNLNMKGLNKKKHAFFFTATYKVVEGIDVIIVPLI